MPTAKKEFSFSLHDVVFEKIGEYWIPKSGVYERRTTYEDGRQIGEKTWYSCDHIDAAPDFTKAGAFTPDIPNGTKMYLDYLPGIDYEWQNGGVVSHVSLQDVAEIKKEIGNFTTPSSAEPSRIIPSASPQTSNSVQSSTELMANNEHSKSHLKAIVSLTILGLIISVACIFLKRRCH